VKALPYSESQRYFIVRVTLALWLNLLVLSVAVMVTWPVPVAGSLFAVLPQPDKLHTPTDIAIDNVSAVASFRRRMPRLSVSKKTPTARDRVPPNILA
jgi:hypothetical protein